MFYGLREVLMVRMSSAVPGVEALLDSGERSGQQRNQPRYSEVDMDLVRSPHFTSKRQTWKKARARSFRAAIRHLRYVVQPPGGLVTRSRSGIALIQKNDAELHSSV